MGNPYAQRVAPPALKRKASPTKVGRAAVAERELQALRKESRKARALYKGWQRDLTEVTEPDAEFLESVLTLAETAGSLAASSSEWELGKLSDDSAFADVVENRHRRGAAESRRSRRSSLRQSQRRSRRGRARGRAHRGGADRGRADARRRGAERPDPGARSSESRARDGERRARRDAGHRIISKDRSYIHNRLRAQPLRRAAAAVNRSAADERIHKIRRELRSFEADAGLDEALLP